MANVLPVEKQILVAKLLAEGSAIRQIERVTDIHCDTIMRLGVRIGSACAKFLDEKMRQLTCRYVEVDEIWGFVGKKPRNTNASDPEGWGWGAAWVHVALDADTKLVPCFHVGKRDTGATKRFLWDLAPRMKNRIQLSSDGMNQYFTGVDDAFGDNIDYGMVVKKFTDDGAYEYEDRRYSPTTIIEIKKSVVMGNPDWDHICTNHVEAQNLTVRHHIKRLARLTPAFSKKIDNLRAAVGLHFAYYNFCRRHSSLRMTPAMAAGLASTAMGVEDLVALAN